MSFSNWMDQAFALRLTIALLHLLWQGVLVALVATLVDQFLARRSAQARYTVHVLALMLIGLSLPVTLALVSHGETGQVRAEWHPGEFSAAKDPTGRESGGAPNDPVSRAEVAHADEMSESGVETWHGPEGRGSREQAQVPWNAGIDAGTGRSFYALLTRSAPWVVVAYSLGVLLLLGRLLHGTWGGLRLRRSATDVVDRELLERIQAQVTRLGMHTVPLVRWSADISVPVVLGVIRPLILLPTSAATGLSVDQLVAVIAHELAHIRRYDLVVNVLQRVVEALLFFHPAVWWISRRVSIEREQACDHFVLSAGFARNQYADALVRMAEVSSALRNPRTAIPATALAADGSSSTEFKRRILKVLGEPAASELRPGRWALVLIAAFALSAIVVPGFWIHFANTAAAQPDERSETNASPEENDDQDERHDPQQHVDETNGMTGHTTVGNSMQLTFSPDSRRLAVINGNPTQTMFQDRRSVAEGWKPTVEIIDTDTETVLRSLVLTDLPHDPNRPIEQGPTFIEATAMAFSPDGRTLAIGTSVGQLKLYDVETGKRLKSLDDEQGRLADDKTPDSWKQLPRALGRVESIAFSADGQRLAVCGESFADWTESLDRVSRRGIRGTAPGRLKVFEVESGRLVFNPAAHSDMAADVAYSPDGRFLASAGRWFDNLDDLKFGHGVILWDARTGERLAQFNLELRGWMYDIEFSSDSQRLLIGAQDFDEGGANGKGVTAMLSSETLAVLWKRPIQRSAMAVAFNPQQRAVIVLTNREGLSYIDADDGKTQSLLTVADPEPPKKQRCEAFAISPQGHLLAYGVVENGRGHIKYLRIGKREPSNAEHSSNPKPGGNESHPNDQPVNATTEVPAQTAQDEPPAPAFPQDVESPVAPAAQLEPKAVEHELLRKLVRGGKIDTRSWNAMSTLVANHAVQDAQFARLVLQEFDKSCAGGEPNRQATRHLLAVVTDVFEAWGGPRWREQLAPLQPEDQPQRVSPNPGEELESEALALVVKHGRNADRSDIGAFALAVRALHRPESKPFLRDVLDNPATLTDPYEPLARGADAPDPKRPAARRPTNTTPAAPGPAPVRAGKWKDNLGGTWTDAKFVSAVGLAELGEATAVAWLLDRAQPNEFGIDDSLFESPHHRDRHGSLRESSHCTLTDLFGQSPDSTPAQLSKWWNANKTKFIPRPVALRPGRAGQAVPNPLPAAPPPKQPHEAPRPPEDAQGRATIPVRFDSLECLLVDEKTGETIPGNDFSICLRFVIPPAADHKWQLIDEVFFGPDHPGQHRFSIPEKVLSHPDRDLIEVVRYIVHPTLDPVPVAADVAGPRRLRVNEVLFNDPRTARESLRRVAMKPANIYPGERPAKYNEFTARVFVLNHQRMDEIGRDELIAEFERLLRRFPNHPDRAEAMYAIANCWDCSDPPRGRQPELEKSLDWLTRAVAATHRDRKLWYETRFMLASRRFQESPDAAHRILDEVFEAKPGPVLEVRAWGLRHTILLHQGSEERAERICRDLHQRMGDARRENFAGAYELGEFYDSIQTTGYHMLLHWSQSSNRPWPERQAKIRSFCNDFPFRHVGQAYDQLVSAGLIPQETAEFPKDK